MKKKLELLRRPDSSVKPVRIHHALLCLEDEAKHTATTTSLSLMRPPPAKCFIFKGRINKSLSGFWKTIGQSVKSIFSVCEALE